MFEFAREPHQSSRSVIDWFLIALICLIPLDVGIRRVQIDWSVVRGWFSRSQPATATAGTMGALLKRKEQVQTTMEVSQEPDPVIVRKTPKPEPPKKADEPKPAKSKAAPKKKSSKEPDWDSMSTTEKLLARKRQRKNDDS